MVDHSPFPADPDDTKLAIMKATFEALATYGYADLTIKRINESFPKSEGLLYHHYDSKDELLLDFLECLLKWFEDREISDTADTDPETRLQSFLDHTITPNGGQEARDFERVFIELRAQASRDAAYRKRFIETRNQFHEYLRDIIQDGVDAGVFRDVDPDQVANYLMLCVSGSFFERITVDRSAEIRAEIDEYLERRLFVAENDQ